MNKEEIIQEIQQLLRISYNRRLMSGKLLDPDWVEQIIIAQLAIVSMENELSQTQKEEITSKLQAWSADYKIKVQVESTYIISSEGNPAEIKIRDREQEISWNAWNRYAAFLELNRGFEYSVIDSIKKSTLDIIERLPSPRDNECFDCRGLVVGDVQSGKTANYAGLLARAADAGYRVIVVAAGGTNSLRKQTQMRLERDFADLCTDPNAPQGIIRVGAYGDVPYNPTPWTSVESDFVGNNQNVDYAALRDSSKLVFMVIKKNGTVLRRIIETFQTMRGQNPEAFRQTALLFVDDEADYASVNARGDDDPTIINRRIREILEMFDKSSYVGYTATPYANVFINPTCDDAQVEMEDLFPRDFICSLGTPDNYQGAQKLFLSDPETNYVIQTIEPEEEFKKRLKKGDFGNLVMPESLEDALCAYILAHAIIRCRGSRVNLRITGMLIHADRLRRGHAKLFDLVKRKFKDYETELCVNAWGEIDQESLPCLARLQRVWDKWYEGKQRCDVPITWAQVRQKMCSSDFLNEFDILLVNGDGSDIDYSSYNKAALICIGGDKLARGLTIEGLTTTYFLRSSRQYDSLMQMGRWFGYRPGYDDICRVFMPKEIKHAFSEIASATEELKYSFQRMNAENLTPMEYGLKVRNNIRGLLITGPQKMRNARNYEEHISTAGSFFFTNRIPAETNLRERTNAYYRDFIRTLHMEPGVKCNETDNAYIWENVPAAKILAFLKDLKNNMRQNIYSTGPFALGAENVVNDALLQEEVLDVSLVKLVRESGSNEGGGVPAPIPMEVQGVKQSVSFGVRRKAEIGSDNMYTFAKNNATSPVDERGGLTDKEISKWKEHAWSDERKMSRSTMNRMDYRACRGSIPKKNKPLLILTGYYVPENGERENETAPDCTAFISACGLSFPDSESAGNGRTRTVRYMYNRVACEQMERQLQEEREDEEE